jgi:hypothetical protein
MTETNWVGIEDARDGGSCGCASLPATVEIIYQRMHPFPLYRFSWCESDLTVKVLNKGLGFVGVGGQ